MCYVIFSGTFRSTKETFLEYNTKPWVAFNRPYCYLLSFIIITIIHWIHPSNGQNIDRIHHRAINIIICSFETFRSISLWERRNSRTTPELWKGQFDIRTTQGVISLIICLLYIYIQNIMHSWVWETGSVERSWKVDRVWKFNLSLERLDALCGGQ
jgi:hypothetical protein